MLNRRNQNASKTPSGTPPELQLYRIAAAGSDVLAGKYHGHGSPNRLEQACGK
jgi:hypothetical protein